MALYTAFPDFKTNITEIIAEDDRVLVFTNTTGTHQGPVEFAPGIDPTGKLLSFQTADLYTIAEMEQLWSTKMLLKLWTCFKKWEQYNL